MNSSTQTHKMTLPMLTASIAGNMMGSGIFLLPATLAGIGSISLFGWIFTLIGACALALVFAKLGMCLPQAGGPYAFTRHSFGDYLGFQTAFLYWCGAWIGNIAIAIVIVGYLSFFFPILHDPMIGCLVGLGIVWMFVFLNMFGPRITGRMQMITTSIMLIPILGTGIFGWFWFDKSIFLNAYHVADINAFDAIMRSASMTLWAFIGVETACVNAGVVENPSKTVPLATLLGVSLAGCAYILSSTVMMGIIPAAELANSSAPFSLFAEKIIGPKAGAFVSICAIIACMGTLSGWGLVVGQISKAAADHNLFPRFFGIVNRKNVPYLGLLFAFTLLTVLYTGTLTPSIGQSFTFISETTVFMIVLPYLYSCASLFIILKKNSQDMPATDFAFYGFAAMLGAVYTFLAIAGLGQKVVFYGSLTALLTILFYLYPALKKAKS